MRSLSAFLLVCSTALALQNTTATKLTVSSTQIVTPQSVTLAAKVTAIAANTPVAPGTVNFYDGSKFLGAAQLATAGSSEPFGTATLIVRLGTGTHQLTASFAGTNADSPSQSQAQSVVATGKIPTSTALTSTEQGACVYPPGTCTFSTTLIGTVFNAGPLAPTGTVNFIDLTNKNRVVGSGILGNTISSQGFAPPIASAVNAHPKSLVVEDFNADGIPDVATADDAANNLGVLLGKGDGSFQAQKTYPVGNSPQSIASGDFNDDGIPDLVVTNADDNTVSVLLGNGDGTFQTQVTYAVGAGPDAVAVGDFNADGILDLVVVNGSGSDVSVLLGNRDGTFGNQTTYSVGKAPNAAVVGDFNGDSRLDLAVVNGSDDNVSLLLGNGDGTLQPQATYAVGTAPDSVAVGDLNADGLLDLVVANNRDNTVSVLLGSGNGVFQPQVVYPVGSAPDSVAVSDLNSDGIPDVAVLNSNDADVGVLLGQGNGDLQQQTTYPVDNGPGFLAIGDFNSDGYPDIVVAAASAIDVLANVTESALATYTFPNQGIAGGGTHQIEAVYLGDSTHSGSSSAPETFPGVLIPTSLTVSASPNSTVGAGQPVKLNASIQPPSADNYTTTGTVTFYANGAPLGSAPVANGAATLTTTSLPVGTDTITATYSGDGNFAGSTSANYLLTVKAPDFSITVIPPTEIVHAGVLAAFVLQLQSLYGFNGSVKLSCSGGPPDSKCAELPQTVYLKGTAYALSGILFPRSTKPGIYKITFTGVSGQLTHTATATFTLKTD